MNVNISLIFFALVIFMIQHQQLIYLFSSIAHQKKNSHSDTQVFHFLKGLMKNSVHLPFIYQIA